MNGIDKITKQIETDTQAEVQEILSKAKAEADAITADYQAKADAKAEVLNEKAVQNAQQREARLASMAQMEARKLHLTAKQEMVGRAFDKAIKDLENQSEDDYQALMTKLVVKTVRTGEEQVIFSTKDRERVGKTVVTRANEELTKLGKPGKLTVAEETRDMSGGLILRDEKVETNCSFEVLIHLQRDTLAAKVADVLF